MINLGQISEDATHLRSQSQCRTVQLLCLQFTISLRYPFVQNPQATVSATSHGFESPPIYAFVEWLDAATVVLIREKHLCTNGRRDVYAGSFCLLPSKVV
jgi:hypothetical protein